MKLILLNIMSCTVLLFTNQLLAKEMIILVHPFQNTGSQQYSWIAAGMTSSVISDLGKVKDIIVISEMDRKKAVQEIQLNMTGLIDDEKTVEVGKVLGANIIFTGNYLVSGNKIRVNANLINVEKGNIEKTVKVDGTVDEIFDLQDKIVFTLMAETEKIQIADIKPVKFSEKEKEQIENIERPNQNAYKLYSQGLQIFDTNPRKALDFFKQAIQLQHNYTDALIWAGITSGCNLNMFVEGLEYLKKADVFFKNRGQIANIEYADLMVYFGLLYTTQEQWDSALGYYSQAKVIYDNFGRQNTKIYAMFMSNIGAVYFDKGQPDTALEYYFNAKAIHENLGLKNTENYALLMVDFGLVYALKEQMDKALDNYFNAKNIYKSLKLNNSDSYALLMHYIGRVYHSKNQLDIALNYYLNAETIYKKLRLQNTEKYAKLMQDSGLVYSSKGQLDNALENHFNAKRIYENLGLKNTMNYANIILNIGVAYSNKGQADNALEYYFNAKGIYEKLNLKNTNEYLITINNIKIIEQRRKK